MRHTFIRTRSQNSDLLHGVVTLDLPDSLQLRARFALENRGASTVRIILFSPHPESIFYPSYSSKGQQLDFPLNIAACLTNIEVKPEYFEWFYKMLLQRDTDRFGAPLGEIISRNKSRATMIDAWDSMNSQRERKTGCGLSMTSTTQPMQKHSGNEMVNISPSLT